MRPHAERIVRPVAAVLLAFLGAALPVHAQPGEAPPAGPPASVAAEAPVAAQAPAAQELPSTDETTAEAAGEGQAPPPTGPVPEPAPVSAPVRTDAELDSAGTGDSAAVQAAVAPGDADTEAADTEAADVASADTDGVDVVSQASVPGEGPGLALPGRLALHGRFDLAYEHSGYHDHPLQAGTDRFRNYHHFLFLTRDPGEDGVGLQVEAVDLSFYELHFQHRLLETGPTLTARAGKLLVPFGADPLFHHNYGGRSGFDQRVLPPVWAQHGVSVNVEHRLVGVGAGLSWDAYALRGYALDAPDAFLNLQSDFSDSDANYFMFGQRLALSYRAATAYYSLVYNYLGFGRRLLLQALDVGVWRWPGLPVLRDTTFDLGFIRADVTGGGPGQDSFHFASYAQLRYYPQAWLYLQYRQGLHSLGNRRGVLEDTTRFGAEDGSTHNLAVVARRGGLSLGLYHFWFLEKAGEVPDDMTRVVVAYDF